MKVDIRSRIERELAEMVPLKSEEEVVAMTAAGPLAIPFLAPRFEYNANTASACVRALLQIGSEAALDALQAYTTDDTSAVASAFMMGLRDATDKTAYAQRFLSHIKYISPTPATIELLPFLSHLSRLTLFNPPQGFDLSFLERLPALSSLWLSELPQVSDLSFLEHLIKLESISIGGLANGSIFPQHVLKRVRITRLT